MSSLMYQILTSATLLTLGIYHLASTTRHFLKSPQTFIAKPFHPLPTTTTTTATASRFRHFPLYLTLISLLLHSLHFLISSFLSDPLLLGHSPVHHFSSLHSSSISFLFSLLTFFYLLSTTFSSLLPSSDVFFALSSAAFYLQYSSSSTLASLQTSLLQSRCDSLSSTISLLSSLSSLALAVFPSLFVFDVALAASICLHGLWALQTGMSLYVDAFIPEGCHRLLDVVAGIEGSTKCDLEESKLRAVAILDLAFVVHVGVVVLLVFAVYAVVAKVIGVSRRFGSYEVLPNTAVDANNHVQLKTLSGTQA